MKKTIILALLGGLTFSGISAFAEGRDNDDVRIPFAPEISTVLSVNEPRENIGNKPMVRVKAKGAQLIKERINALKSTKVVINQNKSLTVDQKASLSAIIDTNIIP